MTLEEIIKQRLDEATKEFEQEKSKKQPIVEQKKSLTEEDLDYMSQEEFNSIDEGKDSYQKYLDMDKSAKKENDDKGYHQNMMTYHKNHKEDAGDNYQHAGGAGSYKLNKDKESFHAAKLRRLGVNVPGVKEDTQVSDQVSALLETEGLSEEFKIQAVTIFEAAVTDRVLQITEDLEEKYNVQLAEATAELETNIDGFLSAVVQEWADDNEVSIAANFKSRLAENFMEGLKGLLSEHNIDLPEDSTNALDVALAEVKQLEEFKTNTEDTINSLQEEIDSLKSKLVLESFKDKMTSTEFDRFVQLTDSVKFVSESQYEKQLGIVLDNFGTITYKSNKQIKPITEDVNQPVAAKIITENNSNINVYAKYITEKAAKF